MTELYDKLIDLYAGRELSEEMERDMDSLALQHPVLAREMRELRATVDALRNTDQPEFTEESYQRVLMKVYARGVEMSGRAPDPGYMQYHLPIQG